MTIYKLLNKKILRINLLSSQQVVTMRKVIEYIYVGEKVLISWDLEISRK